MNRDQKAAVVEDIARQLEAADAIFAVDYRGLSVPQAADLRARLHDAGATFRVVKNSLTERATEQAGAEQLKPLLEGPTALALVEGDAALAAKALNDTARTLRMLEFKGGIMNGTALSAEEIRAIARLPAREVLHAQLVGAVASPLAGLARTLNALIAGVAIQLQQVADQGLVSGTPAQAEPPAAEASAEQPEAEPAVSEASSEEPEAEQAVSEASSEEPEAEQAPTETSPDQVESGPSEPETDEPSDEAQSGG
ncbi:MAG TPA: 50S ribosomal protein L10 [Solirubrobacteraceae bacterium]|nr:50S ribosomal protein L10 [Solirubrobacteraceae bacterium]